MSERKKRRTMKEKKKAEWVKGKYTPIIIGRNLNHVGKLNITPRSHKCIKFYNVLRCRVFHHRDVHEQNS